MAGKHDETSPVRQEPTGRRFCRVCGDNLRPGAAFCSRCGAPVTAPAPGSSGQAALGAAPRGRAGLALALSLLVLLAVLAGAAYHARQQEVATAHAAATATTVARVDARRTATAFAASTATASVIQQATARAAATATALAARTATAGAIVQATADTAATALAQVTVRARATVEAQAARAAAQPVRVCPAAAVPSGAVLCTQPYTTISAADWPGARISYSSVGATFTSTGTHFAISSTSDNGQTFLTLGAADINETSLAAGAASDSLAYLFSHAGVTPEDGTTYQVEVDNGATLLGAAHFSYVVDGASSAGGSTTG